MSEPTKKQLEQEINRLNNELKSYKSNPKNTKVKQPILKPTIKWLAFALACAILVVANLVFYTARTLVETEKFSAVSSKIIQQPAVQDAVAHIATDALYENVDIESIFNEALPERAQPAAPILASSIEKFTYDSTKTLLANESFQDKASQIITKSHEVLISGVKQSNGDGSVNVNELYQAISNELQNTKLQSITNKQLPSKVGNIQIFQADWLATVHTIVNDLNTIRLVTFILVLILVAIFIWLSRNKRKALVQLGLALFLIGLFTLTALNISKSIAVDQAVKYPEAVGQIWDVVVSPLKTQTIGAMAFGLGLALFAWVGGASRSAVSTRSRITALFNGKVHSALFKKENGLTKWVGNNKRYLNTAVGIAYIVSLLVVSISIGSFVALSLVAVFCSLLVEAIAKP